jgi:N-methylhydantoinase B
VVVTPDDHGSVFSVGGTFGQASPPAGRLGGTPGEATRVLVVQDGDRTELDRSWLNRYLSDGDTYVQHSGGGGGVGAPFEREPQKVLRDVEDEYVSMSAAREQYGVAIDRTANGEFELQVSETNRLRERDPR